MYAKEQKHSIKKVYKEVSKDEKYRIHAGSPLAKLINMKKKQHTKRFDKQNYKGPERQRDLKGVILAKALKNKSN